MLAQMGHAVGAQHVVDAEQSPDTQAAASIANKTIAAALFAVGAPGRSKLRFTAAAMPLDWTFQPMCSKDVDRTVHDSLEVDSGPDPTMTPS